MGSLALPEGAFAEGTWDGAEFGTAEPKPSVWLHDFRPAGRVECEGIEPPRHRFTGVTTQLPPSGTHSILYVGLDPLGGGPVQARPGGGGDGNPLGKDGLQPSCRPAAHTPFSTSGWTPWVGAPSRLLRLSNHHTGTFAKTRAQCRAIQWDRVLVFEYLRLNDGNSFV